MIKLRVTKPKKPKMDAHIWLTKNFEYVIDKYGTGGRYVVIIGDKGIVYTDANGSPDILARRVKREFPGSKPLFFRVPRPRDFLCALIVS